jgi:hypothetical protein
MVSEVPALLIYFDISQTLDASHKRQEAETDLIGAYYLEVGEAPLAQFGYRDDLPL